MHKIAIIADSTCSIPADLVKKYDIRIIPQHVIWGTEDLLDSVDIDAKAFYERLAKDPVHPKTSQPPATEFAQFLKKAKKDGAKEALICTISEPLSGTFASAEQAKAEANIPVHVHDSRSAGMGLGWQVIAAARAREKGASLEEMVAAAENVRKHLAVILTVETLEFLHRGGRIGGAGKLVLSAINLKPQLEINPETGEVDRGELTRTRRKAVEATYRAFFKKIDTHKPFHVAVHHAAAAEECDALVAQVRREYPAAEVVMTELTPVLGTHLGPGTLALCGYSEV